MYLLLFPNLVYEVVSRKMLTFIHLSDIHFSSGDNGSQFDLNQQIRTPLLNDLADHPAGISNYHALLITGDIAYSGKKEEYEIAKQFLEEIYSRTGLSMKETYVVPGNHDVDRTHVQPNFPLWASHAEIRRHATPAHWRDTIVTQIKKDPAQLLLSPLRAYNDFAQGCGCQTTANDLAWSWVLPSLLELGFKVRLSGLNSALISDEADAPAKLLISEFQTAKLCDTLGEINVVMSHHPPDWLMDKRDVRMVLRRFAPVVLFGHEHDLRLDPGDKQVQLFAGALQPERDGLEWRPTYHILQLAIEGSADRPKLLVRVHTREYHNYGFRAWRYEDDRTVFEHKLAVPAYTPQMRQEAAGSAETVVDSSAAVQANGAEAGPVMDARRELLVQFFKLPTPQRYEAAFKAGLLRDGDDGLDPQVMWSEVFRRATEENKLADFWAAVAAHTPSMTNSSNPFGKASDA